MRKHHETERDWQAEIADAWNAGIQSTIRTGELLTEAKNKLSHGQWRTLIKAELPFGPTTEWRLRYIASRPTLKNVSNWKHLPRGLQTLVVLGGLPERHFLEAIAAGVINPLMTFTQASILKMKASQDAPDPEAEAALALMKADKKNAAPIPVPELVEKRSAYLAAAKKLSAKDRSLELQLCAASLCFSRQEQQLAQLERRADSEEMEHRWQDDSAFRDRHVQH